MNAIKSIVKEMLCLVALLAAGAVQAAWQPGLRYGVLPYSGNANDFRLDMQPEVWETVSYPIDADTKVHWPTAKGKTGVMVYQGQIRLAAGAYWFVEHCDDSARLVIDGKVVLSDVSWGNPALGRFVAETDGWYDFELRFVDGGGGYGPSAPALWWTRTGIAFAWKVGDEEAGSSVDANKVPDAYSVPRNAEGATLDNCLFRCDDGKGFDDELVIAQLPFAIPVEMTPAEKERGLKAGDKVDCSSANVYEAEDGLLRADLTGYILSNRTDGVWGLREEKTDGTASVNYEHDGKPNTLVWTWAVQYKLTVGADEGGTVNVSTGWVDKDDEVTLLASHPSMRFVSWNGDITPEQALENPVTVTMDQARTISAHFGAAEVYVDSVNGNDANGGFSPDQPKKTFAEVMKIASGGFTVHLAAGTYNVTAETVVNDAIRIVGDGATPGDVVIKGNGNVRVLTLNNELASLENLTVSDGRLTGGGGSNHPHGGNVLIAANGGTVTNCVLRNCTCVAWGEGGGVYIESDKGLVTHCVITNNVMTDGNMQGGTAVGVSAGRIEYCLIANNMDYVTCANNNNYQGAVRMNGGTMDYCTVVGNIDYADAIYVASGATITHTVIARNHNLYQPQAKQVNATDAVKTTAFADSVWDAGDLNASCPQGEVRFVDYASGDYRLAKGSAGAVADGHDWGCFDVDEVSRPNAAAEPETITVAPGGDVADALKRVRYGGTVVLQAGDYPVSGLPLLVNRGITLCGEGEDITAAKIKASGTPKGSLVVLSHKDALLTGVTVTDNTTTSGGNNAANGVTVLQDGGTISNCVIRNMALTSNAHSGTAVRLGKDGAHLTRCVISNITTHANTSYGGAVALTVAGTLVDNCLLSDCNCDNWSSTGHQDKSTPGAFYMAAGLIANCTVVNCKGAQVAVLRAAGGTMRDCILWNNRRCNEGYPEYGAISLTSDKCTWENVFADLEKDGAPWTVKSAAEMAFVDLANGNYRLTINSVAKDSGERHLAAGVCTRDLDGNPRRVAPCIDAGCYEEPHGPGMLLLLK